MCCETNVQRPQSLQAGCGCGCTGLSRRFLSAQEEKVKLEEYQDQLKKELAGVQECINQLQKA
ncbi:MAG: hypothetical protein HY787_11410 [Deltaproteobacteria bacterium]|nr:hypothetical protein [Deltaproteobacteria bacterium]